MDSLYFWGLIAVILAIPFLRIKTFRGAGWALPWAIMRRYYVGIYFHCGRGLYLQIGRVQRLTKEARKAIDEIAKDPERAQEFRELLDSLKDD